MALKDSDYAAANGAKTGYAKTKWSGHVFLHYRDRAPVRPVGRRSGLNRRWVIGTAVRLPDSDIPISHFLKSLSAFTEALDPFHQNVVLRFRGPLFVHRRPQVLGGNQFGILRVPAIIRYRGVELWKLIAPAERDRKEYWENYLSHRLRRPAFPPT